MSDQPKEITYKGLVWEVRDYNTKTGRIMIRHYYSAEPGDHGTITITFSQLKKDQKKKKSA